MSKPLIAAALALVLPSLAFAGDPTGLWKTQSNDDGQYLKVRIEPCGDKLCGVIAGGFDKAGVENPDYEHKGRNMIEGMEPDGENKWSEGTIWAPDDDETYSSNMELKGDVLAVEGCVLFICRGQDWTRTN